MKRSKSLTPRIAFAIVLVAALGLGGSCWASEARLSEGATVYVPVYSHIYVGIKGHKFELAISLVVRNTDPSRSITVSSVAYHNASGKLVRAFLEKPVELAPLASTDFFVSEADTTGGLGAAFLVKWKCKTKVNEPIIEGVMVGAKSGQGISFSTRGRTIEDSGQ